MTISKCAKKAPIFVISAEMISRQKKSTSGFEPAFFRSGGKMYEMGVLSTDWHTTSHGGNTAVISKNASSGNQTRSPTVAGLHSTTGLQQLNDYATLNTDNDIAASNISPEKLQSSSKVRYY